MSDGTQQHGSDLIDSDELVTRNGAAVVDTIKVQRVKVGYGADSDLNDVSYAQPLPVVSRPLVALGHYQLALQTGAIGAGASANSEIFQFRWTDATRFAVIQKILINGLRATTAFAAGAIDIKATRATSWSAQGTGGTAVTLTSPQGKMRGSMGASLIASGDMRIATTAALGAGTKTLETQDLGLITSHSASPSGPATPAIGAVFLPVSDLFTQDLGDDEHPLVLATNEGLVVRATVPGTGVWNLGLTIKWAEVAAF